MKRPTNVHKFKIAATLVGVLVVGVIGYTLWFVNHSEKVANDAYAKSGNSYTVKPAKKVAASKTATQQYLTIKEWGVKIPISGDLTDAYYVSYLGSMSLSKAAYKGTNCAADQTTLGAIRRITATEKDGITGATLLSETPSAVKIGNYYYYYVHPQQGCDAGANGGRTDFDQAKGDAADKQMNEFKQAVAKISAADAQQYLTIKEWGVKISIDDPALTNAVYKAPKSLVNLESGVESVALMTKSTASMDFTCGGEGTGEPITHMTSDPQDALLRAKTPAILSKASNSPQSAFTHIGGYYYVYQNSTGYGPCGITDSKLAAQVSAMAKAFPAASIVAE